MVRAGLCSAAASRARSRAATSSAKLEASADGWQLKKALPGAAPSEHPMRQPGFVALLPRAAPRSRETVDSTQRDSAMWARSGCLVPRRRHGLHARTLPDQHRDFSHDTHG